MEYGAASFNFRRATGNGMYCIQLPWPLPEGMQIMEWISVEDGFPTVGEKVLVCQKGNPYITIDYVDHPKDGNIWALTDKNWLTHWMPLPEVPK